MSPFYIFLAIIGGVQYFGLAGIVYGPLILAFAMVMLYIYQVEYRDFLVGLKGDESEPLLPDQAGEGSDDRVVSRALVDLVAVRRY